MLNDDNLLKRIEDRIEYDLIIADDLVSEKNIKTGYAKESIYKYFKDLLDLLDHPNGVIEVVGTRWDFGDLYSM